MKAEEYATRALEIDGWKVRLTSYKLGDTYHCTADNMDPGAAITRTEGKSREEAENLAIERATKYLKQTRKFPPG